MTRPKAGKQDSEERYWKQQFCQMESDISVPLKVDHLQRLSQILLSDQTEMVRSIWFLTQFCDEWKAPKMKISY